MAKKTKDSNLSVEERLEQALIPNWDEPYKLPENWCWTKIGTVTNLYRGVSYKKHEGHSEKGENDCLVMRGGNILEGEIDVNADNIYVHKDLVSNEQYVKKHDIVIVSSTGSTKVIGRAGISYADYDDVAFGAFLTLVRPVEKMYKPYVSYYFQGDMYRNRMRQLASGVNINNIRNEYITDTPFPMPPLEEQKRIATRIELLFTKLDEAKEKAHEVVDGFETRKAAILHKAFSGELTAKWREENGINNCSYAKKRFDEVAIIKSNLVDPSEYQDYPHIAPDNIEKKTGILLEYHTIAEDGVKSGKHRFYPGQILYSKIRPNLSKVVVVDFDGLCSADMYPIEAFGDTKCLWYFMLSENFLEQASSAGSRSVLPKINQKELSALTVTIPESIDEQKQLSRIIDSLFVKEYQVKESAEAVIEQIDTIKKAILARAFRGELGTNDPSEESAVELLKQVLNTVVEPKKSIKRTTIPKALDNRIKTDLERKIIKLYFQNEVDVLSIDLIMGVSSKKFEIMEALRNLQQRGLLEKQNDKYKLLG